MSDTIDSASHSETEVFAACERRHFYQYGKKLQAKGQSESLLRGNAGHHCLAVYYQGRYNGLSHDDAADNAIEGMHEYLIEHGAHLFDLEKFQAALDVLMNDYFDVYGDEPMTIHQIEELHNIQLTSEFSMPVKIDLVAEFHNHPEWGLTAVDHKVVYDFYDVDKLDLNPQLVRYFVALREMGIPVKTLIYNQLRHRTTKDNAKDPSEKFARDPVTTTKKKVVQVMREHMMAAKRITALKSLGEEEWEKSIIRNSLHCQMCPFRTLCAADLCYEENSAIEINFYEDRTYS